MNIGLIKITKSFYEEDWDITHILFKDFRPTHIEFRHWENDIWYLYGESKLFDEVKQGEVIPTYDVIFTFEEGMYTYKFEKVS